MISKMTLSFMDDSGWYRVNYKMTQILNYGLKKGCDFFNEECSSKIG